MHIIKFLTIANDALNKKLPKAQWFDAISITHKRGMTSQLLYIKPSCKTFCHCCKHFKKSNMDNSQYEIIYNYVTRGEYPAQSSKEQKRSIRRMVQSRNADDGLHKKFITKDGVLYFVDKKSDGLGLRERRVVRLEESTSIIRECHEAEIGGGHFKRDKTFGKISERFYWHGMMKDVKEYVSSCDVCQRVDGKLGKQHAELHPIPVSDVWKQVRLTPPKQWRKINAFWLFPYFIRTSLTKNSSTLGGHRLDWAT